MKAEKGKLIEFANGEKYFVVETIVEGANVWHCFVSEDNSRTVYCTETRLENGSFDYQPVLDDAQVAALSEKFKPLLNIA